MIADIVIGVVGALLGGGVIYGTYLIASRIETNEWAWRPWRNR